MVRLQSRISLVHRNEQFAFFEGNIAHCYLPIRYWLGFAASFIHSQRFILLKETVGGRAVYFIRLFFFLFIAGVQTFFLSLFLAVLSYLQNLVSGAPELPPLSSFFLFSHFLQHFGVQSLFLLSGTVFGIAIEMFASEAQFADELSTTGTLSGFEAFFLDGLRIFLLFPQKVFESILLDTEFSDLKIDLSESGP